MQNHLFCKAGQPTKVLSMSVPSTPEKLVQASHEWLAMEPSFSTCKSIQVWCCFLETLAIMTAGTAPVDYWLQSLLKGHTELEGFICLQTLSVALLRVEDIQNLDGCPSEYHIPWNLLLIILPPQKRDDNFWSIVLSLSVHPNVQPQVSSLCSNSVFYLDSHHS